MLVRGFDSVERIARLVQSDEELLRVAVESALSSLVGSDFYEGVMATFLAHAQLECSEIARERPRAGRVSRSLHPNLGKEFVGDA